MLRSDFRELYRESVGSKALLAAGLFSGAVYCIALIALIVGWDSPSMPSIIAIYVAVPYGVATFAVVFPIVAIGFAMQEFLRRRRESKNSI